MLRVLMLSIFLCPLVSLADHVKPMTSMASKEGLAYSKGKAAGFQECLDGIREELYEEDLVDRISDLKSNNDKSVHYFMGKVDGIKLGKRMKSKKKKMKSRDKSCC